MTDEQPLPDLDAPHAEVLGPRRRTGWAVLAAGGVALVAAVVVAVVVFLNVDPAGVGDATPSPSSDASPEDTLSASQTAGTTVEPSPTATVEPVAGWHEAATFGADGFIDRVGLIARVPGGFIAVGIHFEDFGPLVAGPMEGRVWQSADGRGWQDVTPPDVFTEAYLGQLFVTADGALVLLGSVRESDIGPPTPMAWESADGLAWSSTASPIPDGSPVGVAVGAQGYLALLGDGGLWLSSDGRAWEMVMAGGTDGSYISSVAAGDEGFMAIGTRSAGDVTETYAIASSDGRTWIEATDPPAGAYTVVPRGGDWFATGSMGPPCGSAPRDIPVWSSASGLEWAEIGSIPLRPIPEWTEFECWRVGVGLHAAGRWLLADASAGPACCDNPPTQGTRHISRDGRSWESLSLPGVEDGSPAAGIADAITDGDLLILVGHVDKRAVFWFNEAP